MPAARLLLAVPLLLALLLSPAVSGEASADPAAAVSRLYRIDIRPGQGYTRISVKLDTPPRYTLSTLPGNRLRLTLKDTVGPLLRKYRRYSDVNIGGLVFSRRGSDMLVTFQIARGAGWRDLSRAGISAVTIDVGRRFAAGGELPVAAGREKIRSGIEKLVRDFEPPLKTEIPFVPTDRQVLKNLLDEPAVELFMAAEAALYKGQLSAAEEGLVPFSGMQGAIRALALYRLGETRYKLQKYPQALAAFQEAEKLWPAYLNLSPSATFYYGDSIARSGDTVAARGLLAGLISRLSDKAFAPSLLVRLADIQARQGNEREARAIYLTVASQFRDGKASLMARLRLADAEFFSCTPWTFRELASRYHDISRESNDIDLREEALFKEMLLVALHGGTPEALMQVTQFQKRFPHGVYAAVCRTIREVLVAQAFQEAAWGNDPAGVARFVEEHQDYLGGCVVIPGFLGRVARSYSETGRPIELVRLFDSLLKYPWSPSDAAYLHEAIAESAEVIGDIATARSTLQAFLRKYPRHPRTKPVMEKLGALLYQEGKLPDAKNSLQWLLGKKERAAQPESYYYLGRSLWGLKEYADVSRAMELFLSAAVRGGAAERLMPDAHMIAALSRDAAGDRKGALRLLDAGLRLVDNPRRDEFLYKAGEISLRNGQKQAARAYFDQLAAGGKDSDWQRMAKQAAEGLAPPPR